MITMMTSQRFGKRQMIVINIGIIICLTMVSQRAALGHFQQLGSFQQYNVDEALANNADKHGGGNVTLVDNVSNATSKSLLRREDFPQDATLPNRTVNAASTNTVEKNLVDNVTLTPSNASSEHDQSWLRNEESPQNATLPLNATSNNASVSSNVTKATRKHVLWNIETRQDIIAEIKQHRGNLSTARSMLLLSADGESVLGTIQPSGKLVVNVNESYAFWNGGQPKLCQLLRIMTLRPSLVQDPSIVPDLLPPPLLNLTMDCEGIIDGLGTGNWVTALYAVRMAAHLAKVDYQFQCQTPLDKRFHLLPWFEGYYPAPPFNNTWPYDNSTLPTESQACPPKYPYLRIDRMALAIQSDIRRMAQQVLRLPMFSEISLDQVAIHFRCGDIMGGVRRGDFGMIAFSEYIRWIRNSTTSIGILTQPFDKNRTRQMDSRKTENCRQATLLLVDYLQQYFSSATISIHNGPNETLPLAYARLAMANQSFTSLSSFGIFPIIGTFGEGYFQKGNRGVNPFSSYLSQYLPNLHEMKAPVKSSAAIQSMGLEATLAWFVGNATDEQEEEVVRGAAKNASIL